jgi:hypothetical protein
MWCEVHHPLDTAYSKTTQKYPIWCAIGISVPCYLKWSLWLVMQHRVSFYTLYSYYLVIARQLMWINNEYCKNTQQCGPSEYNSEMLGAQYEYEFPCTNFKAFYCYNLRAHKTIIEYWVLSNGMKVGHYKPTFQCTHLRNHEVEPSRFHILWTLNLKP